MSATDRLDQIEAEHGMDDLQAVTRTLVDNDRDHRVTFGTWREPAAVNVFGSFVNATFRRNRSGSWDLVRATYDRRPETITGLLNSIRGA